MRKPAKAAKIAPVNIASGSGKCATCENQMQVYAPMAMNPAWPSVSCPVTPVMMLTLIAIIALIPARVKICAVYASIKPTLMSNAGTNTDASATPPRRTKFRVLVDTVIPSP